MFQSAVRCLECSPSVLYGFDDDDVRDAWIASHEAATGHNRLLYVNGPDAGAVAPDG